MDAVLATPTVPPHPAKKRPVLRGCEWVALAYFSYLPSLGLIRGISMEHLVVLACIPVALWVAWRAQSCSNDKSLEVLRDWWPLGLIPVGYWALEWFAAPPRGEMEVFLVRWDRFILHGAHFQTVVGVAGSFFPALLEMLYLFVYAMPPVCLAILYACGGRPQVPRFLLLLFAGTFATYALLPFIRVISPRIAFPNSDLPPYSGIMRDLNTWVLDHLDISTSVLPSGHVAVALSSALGMVDALPQRPGLGRFALGMASLVYLATVYGRYHYAVDGLVSILVVSLIFQLLSRSSRA